MSKHQFHLVFQFFEASNTWSPFMYHLKSPFYMILINSHQFKVTLKITIFGKYLEIFGNTWKNNNFPLQFGYLKLDDNCGYKYKYHTYNPTVIFLFAQQNSNSPLPQKKESGTLLLENIHCYSSFVPFISKKCF